MELTKINTKNLFAFLKSGKANKQVKDNHYTVMYGNGKTITICISDSIISQDKGIYATIDRESKTIIELSFNSKY